MPERWLQLTCQMPVIRREYTDGEENEAVDRLGRCGHSLYLTTAESKDLMDVGPVDTYTTWKVECAAGHVLILPDDEGNGFSIEPTMELLNEALPKLGTTAEPI
jgi:hypothetical protein